MSTIQIANHSHCLVCTRAVPFGEKTCGKECEATMEETTKRRKNSMRTLWILMIIAFGVAMLPVLMNR